MATHGRVLRRFGLRPIGLQADGCLSDRRCDARRHVFLETHDAVGGERQVGVDLGRDELRVLAVEIGF